MVREEVLEVLAEVLAAWRKKGEEYTWKSRVGRGRLSFF